VVEGDSVYREVLGFTLIAVWFLNERYIGKVVVKFNVIIELRGRVFRVVEIDLRAR
jgi:hypothetical protein